jgi:hypothetical protein
MSYLPGGCGIPVAIREQEAGEDFLGWGKRRGPVADNVVLAEVEWPRRLEANPTQKWSGKPGGMGHPPIFPLGDGGVKSACGGVPEGLSYHPARITREFHWHVAQRFCASMGRCLGISGDWMSESL